MGEVRETSEKGENKKTTDFLEDCDTTDVGKRIAFTPKPLTIHKSKYLPKGDGIFMLLSGKTGTGKSVLLRDIIPMFSEKTKYMIIATRIKGNDCHEAIKKWADHSKVICNIVYNPEHYAETLKDYIDKKKEDDKMLIIFDDFSNYKEGRTDEYENAKIATFSCLRNWGASGLDVTQSYTAFNTWLRRNCRINILYPQNRHAVDSFKEEVVSSLGKSNREKISLLFEKLYSYIETNKFTFICFYTEPARLCLGFSKQIFPPESEMKNVGEDDLKIEEPEPKIRGGDGFNSRTGLRCKAHKLGYPAHLLNNSSNIQLKEYIELRDKFPSITDEDPRIKAIYEVTNLHKPTLRNRLIKLLKKFKDTQDDKYINQLQIVINTLIENGYATKEEIIFKLDNNGILNKFKFN